MLANAVHGSSTAEKAQKVIQTFIGEVREEEEEGGQPRMEQVCPTILFTNLLITIFCICRWRRHLIIKNDLGNKNTMHLS